MANTNTNMKLLEDRTSTVLFNALDFIWCELCAERQDAYKALAETCRDLYMTKDETNYLFSTMATEYCDFFNSSEEEQEAKEAIESAYKDGGYNGNNAEEETTVF